MTTRFIIASLLFVAVVAHVTAQVSRSNNIGRLKLSQMDTLANKPGGGYMYSTVDSLKDIRTNRFYDSLRSKSDNSKFGSFLYNMMIRRPRVDTVLQGRLVDEAAELQKYAGRTIGKIYIDRQDVFEHARSFVQKAANAIHVTTHEEVIRRDLFFKPGERIVPEEIVLTNQLLRSRKYISDLWLEFTPRSGDTTVVDITIITRDSWSIDVNAKLGSENRSSISVIDENILGTGNMLSVQTNYDWDRGSYGGNMFSFTMPNILGSFTRANALIGRQFEDRRFDIDIRKDFYLPTDYEFGLSYNDDKIRFYQLYLDRDTIVSYKIWDGWLGYSKKLGRWRSSGYVIGRYTNGAYTRRPEVGQRYNPRFHSYQTALLGLGMYREKFYAANLIYGFGYKEYLPTGYRLDLTLGYTWGEFNNDSYVGLNYRRGGYTKVGYLMGDATIGTSIDSKTGKLWYSGVDVNMRWFSNLFVSGRSHIRQFVTVNYTHGWNRGGGNDQVLSFTKEFGPRSIKEYLIGRTRGVISTETVIFTPYRPMGFQIALFGYADVGTIGFKASPFSNEYFVTFGLGVRLRNERLIFNTIQLRVGLAFAEGGLIKSRYFQMSTEQRLQQYRFIPTKPEMFEINPMGSVNKRKRN